MEGRPELPGNPVWDFLAYHTDHVPWVGCGFWDLIQPSFMFMAGVAIPYSYASRKNKGESDAAILFHVAVRSAVLVLLGIFLSSNGSQTPGHLLVNVLTQIGLGYFFVYLLRGCGVRVQLAAAAAVLVGYWLWFALFPLPPADFDYRSVGLPETGGYLSGFFAHWEMNTNAAAHFDRWLLNLLPAYAGKPFEYNPGGYQTLNFIPSMATMLFGLMAGELLRGPKDGRAKLGWLISAGSVCIILGQLAGWTVCPIVKRIWTPSWTVVQRRLGVLDAGRLLRRVRSARVEALGVPAHRRRHELHRHLLHVADAQAVDPGHVPQPRRRPVVRGDVWADRAVCRHPGGAVAGVLLAVPAGHLRADSSALPVVSEPEA